VLFQKASKCGDESSLLFGAMIYLDVIVESHLGSVHGSAGNATTWLYVKVMGD
jgi:hypothetical protein